MTPQQRIALEAIAGRALSQTEVEQIDPLLDPNNRNDVAIAAVLSLNADGTPRTRLGSVSTERFQSWAAATGMRSAIEDTASNAAHPLRSIALTLRDVVVGGASGINLGYPGNPEMLQAWVSAGLLSGSHRDALLALAQQPDPVDVNALSRALNVAEGRINMGA